MNIRRQYEQEHPERVGETDKVFAESLYIEWLEAKVIAAQPDVIKSVCKHEYGEYFGEFKCKKCWKTMKEIKQTVL